MNKKEIEPAAQPQRSEPKEETERRFRQAGLCPKCGHHGFDCICEQLPATDERGCEIFDVPGCMHAEREAVTVRQSKGYEPLATDDLVKEQGSHTDEWTPKRVKDYLKWSDGVEKLAMDFTAELAAEREYQYTLGQQDERKKWVPEVAKRQKKLAAEREKHPAYDTVLEALQILNVFDVSGEPNTLVALANKAANCKQSLDELLDTSTDPAEGVFPTEAHLQARRKAVKLLAKAKEVK
jgi:hypothetical protein